MSQVFNNGSNVNQNPQQVMGDLQRLTDELISRRDSVTEEAEIADIELALEQLEEAKQTVQATVKPLNNIKVKAIPEAKVSGIALRPGEKFKSYNGHGISYIDYMSTNIKGLEELLAKS